MGNNRKSNKMKSIFLLILSFGFVLSSNSQDSAIYNKYQLSRFGIVYIPKGLDTLSQTLAKNQIFESNVDRLININKEKMKNRYNVNVTNSLFENINKESYFFWPTRTMLSILDDKFWGYDKDSVFGFDESKIEYVPSITLRKVTVKGNSTDFKKRYFDNKDSARKFVLGLENMMNDFLSDLYSEATVESSSQYYMLQNQFPVVRVSVHISIPVDNEIKNIGQVSYMVFKNYGMYSLKFEFKLEELDKWEMFIKDIMSNSKLL
jgi:hypothetical protein